MKTIIASLLLLGLSQLAVAQWSSQELKPFQQKAEKEVTVYINRMVSSGTWDRAYDALEIEFVGDTMRIEATANLLFGKYYTTMEMRQTISYTEAEYDKLLNKYYKKLMDKLSAEDKVKFRDAQRVWLKYRDSEQKICGEIIAPNKYMGGGTMWPLVASGRMVEIIKERVIAIYQLITYI